MNITAAILVGASAFVAGTGALCSGRDVEVASSAADFSFPAANQFSFIYVEKPPLSVAPHHPMPATNHFPLRGFATPGTRGLKLPPSSIAPGIYKTEPYTCLVLVPGRMDEKFISGTGFTNSGMPTIKPELRMVPWQRK